MTELYIHIPFCKSRCIYCAFYSTTLSHMSGRYVDALGREMDMRHKEADTITSIYIGGGTPSQLSGIELHRLFGYIYNVYEISPDAEITIECNPDDISDDFAAVLSALPVNRVSMGAQTFSDRRLHFINRRHDAAQVASAVSRLRHNGIGNISIDLMYGFPGETVKAWEKDIDRAVALGVEHISAYALTIEEDTPLGKMLDEGKVDETDEELLRDMYYLLTDKLADAGFEHYEISNFALKRHYRSRHNSGYWNGTPYIGIGAAAHSFDGHRTRRWNVGSLTKYLEGMENGTPDYEEERLDNAMVYEDTVMLRLRTCEGINIEYDILEPELRKYCLHHAQKYIADGLLSFDGANLKLTRKGLFVSDMITRELFL